MGYADAFLNTQKADRDRSSAPPRSQTQVVGDRNLAGGGGGGGQIRPGGSLETPDMWARCSQHSVAQRWAGGAAHVVTATRACADAAKSHRLSVGGQHRVPALLATSTPTAVICSPHPFPPALARSLKTLTPLYRLLSFIGYLPCPSWSLAVCFLCLEPLEFSEHTVQRLETPRGSEFAPEQLGSKPVSYNCRAGLGRLSQRTL